MEIIQAIVQKFVNKMSVGFLLLLLTLVFFVWTAGLGFPATLFIYNNSSLLIAFSVAILLILNVYKAKGVDFLYLGVALALFIFFSYFRELRNESLFGDLLFPLIILFCLVIKWIEWTKWDRGIYLIVFSVFLGITLYRVFTEIQVPEGQSIWAPGNSLSDIWINTNIIGSSLMTLALLISGFASSFERWYVRIIGAVAVVAAFLGIWVCQSRGALVALIVFAILDLLPKSLMCVIRAPFIAYTVTILLALPISYLAAVSEKVNLFTGREDIWHKFYQTLGEKSEQILLGMKTFIFQRGNQFLGNHNSYNSILNIYGLIGFGIAALLLILFIGRLTLKADLSNGQMTFIWAFFAVMMQSFMEDTLTSYPWVPIIYILLAMAVHRYDEPEVAEEFYVMEEAYDDMTYDDTSYEEQPDSAHSSRIQRYH
ncbi:EpaQ family protein [Enterococcus faecium]|nr:EpaQ family protein [Enterococcus faecium]MCZ1694216.1 EpaQ family protein [Enterococcus faecium]MCZ1703884.1 EpaQ family protein [Enterococcus faecium]